MTRSTSLLALLVGCAGIIGPDVRADYELLTTTTAALPTVDSPAAGEGGGVVIEAGEEKEVAKVRLAFRAAPRVDLAIAVSSPLAKGASSADFVDLDGLADTLNAEFGLTWSRWPDQSKVTVPKAAAFTDLAESGRITQNFLAQRKAAFTLKAVPMLGFMAKAGRRTFEYRDPTALSQQSTTEAPTAFGVNVGLLFLKRKARDSVLWISAKTERTYKAGPEAQLCTPVSGTSAETCERFRLGPPTSADATVYDVEYRKFFGTQYGIGPRVFRRDKDGGADVTGVDVPIYFLSDGKGGMTGGVRLSWRSNDDDVTAAVFIGKPLGYTKR